MLLEILTMLQFKLHRWLLLSLVLLAWLRDSSQDHETRSGNRTKRIVFGEDLLEKDSGYLVTNYFVWISNKHICGPFDSFGNFALYVSGFDKFFYEMGYYACYVDPQKFLCGGSLLTPTIVQTAGHCVAAKMKTNHHEVTGIYYVKDPFIDMALTYHGPTAAENMKIGYISRMFIVHEKFQERYGKMVYDYGLIVLKIPVSPNAQFSSIPSNFAPIYLKKELKSWWNYFKSKETVCLFVGFGIYTDDINNPFYPTVLQHAWLVMQHSLKCVGKRKGSLNAPWSCFWPLPGKPSRISHGDSGSPITCNNAYIALVSAGVDFMKIPANTRNPRRGKIVTNFTKGAPTIFSPYTNTAEHRPNFVKKTMEEVERIENSRGLLQTLSEHAIVKST